MRVTPKRKMKTGREPTYAAVGGVYRVSKEFRTRTLTVSQGVEMKCVKRTRNGAVFLMPTKHRQEISLRWFGHLEQVSFEPEPVEAQPSKRKLKFQK